MKAGLRVKRFIDNLVVIGIRPREVSTNIRVPKLSSVNGIGAFRYIFIADEFLVSN